MNIFLICTERSGENLLHTYIKVLKELRPHAHFYCQTSYDRFVREGFENDPNMHFLADRSLCSIMGFIQPLKRFLPLLQRTRFLQQQIHILRPALVFGFDGPDFCCRIEKTAKLLKSYTVHVVSPSVWAWRPGRVFTVEKSAHELHHLFAFEQSYYANTKLVTEHIGHPLLAKISPRLRSKAPKTLLLAPGSRAQEVEAIMPSLLKIAEALKSQKLISQIVISRCGDLDPRLYPKESRYLTVCDDFYSAIDRADFAIACSGTATLEIAAHGCPLIIMYPMRDWKKYLLSFFIKTPYIGLPNIVLGEMIAPEFLGSVNSISSDIIELASVMLNASRYKEIAKNFYDKISPIVRYEQSPCLKSIVSHTLSRASMKPAVEPLQDPLSLPVQ